jgi:hypothetical protein
MLAEGKGTAKPTLDDNVDEPKGEGWSFDWDATMLLGWP